MMEQKQAGHCSLSVGRHSSLVKASDQANRTKRESVINIKSASQEERVCVLGKDR